MSNTTGRNGFILTAAMCLGVTAICAQGAGLADGLTFWASYDKAAAPDYAAGSPWSSASYIGQTGRVDRALDNRGMGANYVAADNLAAATGAPQGAVSFWICPAQPLNEVRGVLFKAAWMRLVSDPARARLLFETEHSLPGEAFAWDTSVFAKATLFPTGQWTHVAMTWDCGKQRRALYVNGKEIASGKTARTFRTGAGSSDTFTLGYAAPGAYDELLIWNRALAGDEIKRLYTEPDGVARELRAKPAPAADANWPVDVQLVAGHTGTNALVAPGEPFAIQVPVVSRTNTPQAGTLTLRLLNLWQEQQGEPITVAFNLPTGGVQKISASFSAPRTGVYKVEATLSAGGKQKLRDVVSFGCVPPGIPPRHPFFSAHIDSDADMARRLGFSGNRVHNMSTFTWWQHMEPERGQWKMDGAQVYSNLNALGFEHLGQWMATPYWAVTQPDGKHPAPNGYAGPWVPTDMDAFKEYIRESVKRFPAIKEWEFWNEPVCSQFWLGSAQDYVKYIKIAYETAKATRPDVTIYAQCYISPFFRDALKAGLLDACDGITYHGYCSANEEWDAQRLYIREEKEMVKPYLKKPLLIRNSEAGQDTSTFLRGSVPGRPMNYVASCERLVQFYVTAMAEGVKAWDYYMFGANAASYGSLEIGLGWPRPMVISSCILAWQLNGGKFVCEKELADGALHAYLFERPDGQALAVLWTVEDAIVDVDIKGACFDLMGNDIKMPSATTRITSSPIYLRTPDFAKAAPGTPGTAKALAESFDKAAVTVIEAVVPKVKVASGTYEPKKMANFPVASELGESKLIPLDLKAFANMALKDERAGDWQGGAFDEGAYNDMRDLPSGRHVWLGAPFEIADPDKNNGRCIITLAGATFPSGPTQVGPIPVNRKIRGLFFAHMANWAIEKGLLAGSYTINYEDGKQEVLPIVVGKNIYNWWHDQQAGEESRTVWFECADSLDQSDKNRFIRIWYWENPCADVPVKSIEIKSAKDRPAIAVLGITQSVW